MMVSHRGDRLDFTLEVSGDVGGRAYLRTNLGRGQVRWQEIIDEVELGRAPRKADWRDLPMEDCGGGRFSISVPLGEVGRYMAKAFFEPVDGGQLVWPSGGDVVVKVEPAYTVCGNSMYSAFVRQFGEGKSEAVTPELPEGVKALDDADYSVIPPSGKFRDLIGELDHIIGRMGFRIIQLLPIFPVPTTYARMGRFGSPFAALDFMEVEPSLAEFDRKTTPLDQFKELADAVHARQAKLFIDIPINHTGWASWLQTHHPEWFARDAHSEHFQSPGAWGVTWEDLSELDYEERGLWEYIAEVFLFWCKQGVDGFRCDAGYMVPGPVWRYVVAKVRQQYPDTIFFLEGLGGPLQTMEQLLDFANLDWAYSEMFQTEGRDALSHHLGGWASGSQRRGLEVHFAETHDNNRLAASGETYSRLRVALSALASVNGGYGITAGVEWFAQEKILVHGVNALNWGAESNQVEWIQRVNAVLATHPAFAAGADVRVVSVGDGEQIGLVRRAKDSSVLVLFNLDLERANHAAWNEESIPPGKCFDLLSDETIDSNRMELAPGQVACLCADRAALDKVEIEIGLPQDRALPDEAISVDCEPSAAFAQRTAALEADVAHWFGHEVDEWIGNNPYTFCAKAAGMDRCPMVRWAWEYDENRVVVVPHGWGVMLWGSEDDRLSVRVSEEHSGRMIYEMESVAEGDGTHFALVPPFQEAGEYTIEVVRYGIDFNSGGICSAPIDMTLELSTNRKIGRIYAAPRLEDARVLMTGDSEHYALCTNDRGAMTYVRGAWGEIGSQYDALLAANLHDDFPVDRRMLLVRCRAWVVYRDYSRELSVDCQTGFRMIGENVIEWSFDVPTGGGQSIGIVVESRMKAGENLVQLTFRREQCEDGEPLDDEAAVKLVVRPDVDDRGFHEKTKAFAGAEASWGNAIAARADGFRFSPGGGHALEMAGAAFNVEPEWSYSVGHPVDGSRGLGAESDLYSPGYFEASLREDDSLRLAAGAVIGDAEIDLEAEIDGGEPVAASLTLLEASKLAIADFVVKRDDTRTVIAGYPWFLDWGRDTLICLRGMIAAGMLEESLDILKQFAKFEKDGTLPNMIRGGDDSNRDTSDAPLWFLVGVCDLVKEMGEDAVLKAEAGGRTIADVMLSIGKNYRDGTPNGIYMDAESGLIFSPSHYTWMDTNHPAGTPREGYPIEIQALWFAALEALAYIDPSGEWAELSKLVRVSIVKYFDKPGIWHLADCLHCKPGQSAAEAQADDHLRSNQLFAVTLGAIDDTDIMAQVVRTSEELIVPGGIRSLADQRVEYPLPVERDGVLLNDPHRPYWGRYEGDEDTRRKPGYHNGTVWNWPFPSYAEALYMCYGDDVKEAARSILASAEVPFNDGCLGQLPEIMDGDAPHQERGCGAQAWSATELYRVLALLGEG